MGGGSFINHMRSRGNMSPMRIGLSPIKNCTTSRKRESKLTEQVNYRWVPNYYEVSQLGVWSSLYQLQCSWEGYIHCSIRVPKIFSHLVFWWWKHHLTHAWLWSHTVAHPSWHLVTVSAMAYMIQIIHWALVPCVEPSESVMLLHSFFCFLFFRVSPLIVASLYIQAPSKHSQVSPEGILFSSASHSVCENAALTTARDIVQGNIAA